MPRWKFPGGLTEAGFLGTYWQKQPLFMPSAFEPGEFDLTADELAGLALEDDVEARLFTRDPDGRLQLREPPFAEEDFRSLPRTRWTLLVQDVDKHLPQLADFLDAVNFIPSWRLDDLMISVSAPEGGVGPHVDQYDVFLCQVTGQKTWRLGNPENSEPIAGGPLRQLAGFAATRTFEMSPGDILYLPPGVPHEGIARTLGSTWSVGFRAPVLRELRAALPEHASTVEAAEQRYADPDLVVEESDAGLIGTRALERFRGLLRPSRDLGDNAWIRLLGEYLTSPKPWLRPESPGAPLDPRRLVEKLEHGERLVRHGMALFARAQHGGTLFFFASGQSWCLPESQGELARSLCGQRRYAPGDPGFDMDGLSVDFLVTLYNQGQLLLESELDGI